MQSIYSNRSWQFILAGVIGVTAVSRGDAAVMVALDLKRLSVDAERIVQGKVVATESYWLKGRIVTDARVVVDATHKGTHEREVIVRRLGGEVAGFGQKTWGVAELAIGEEVLLFIEMRLSVFEVVGMAQGKFRVTRNARGERFVARDLGEVALRAEPGGALNVDLNGVISKPRLLGDLLSEIVAHLSSKRRGVR